MVDEQNQALDILARLAEQPAVAFYEDGVATAIKSVLKELDLSYQQDGYGNIMVRLSGQQADAVPLALVAHMDHPGFEAISTHQEYLVCQALGGVPPSSFETKVPLHVVLPDGKRLPATSAGRFGEEKDRQILVRLAEPRYLELPHQVVFDLPDFQVDGELIRMRAADDLAGCAAILTALARLNLSGQKSAGDVYGVFTRAEEVGLMGARLLAESGIIPPDSLIVSAEYSRALPGAEMGSGPVIRVGDAGMTFNADAEAALLRAREKLQSGPGSFKVQRQLMSGGVCEATAFAAYGYRTTGIAFPLGNYHNAAPDGEVRAEYIHLDDYLGGIQLMLEAAFRVAEGDDTGVQQRLRQIPDSIRERLQTIHPQ